MEFQSFPKIPRLSREVVLTEKIDGTNASVFIDQASGGFLVGSRNRWITPEQDNYGFARWAYDHKEELIQGLGDGHHFGEWWGQGIQRKYGLKEKRWSLFNVNRWRTCPEPNPNFPKAILLPGCCHVVPVVAVVETFDTPTILGIMDQLRVEGSWAAPGFMDPEGIVIYHTAAKQYFKKTFVGDEGGKGREP
jgi:hypothetical protein